MELKTKQEIEIMRKAGLCVYEVLQALKEMVKPGVSTAALNEAAIRLAGKQKTVPAFLGYPARNPSVSPFPCAICASVNSAIVHGLANELPLVEGDIVSIDYGCILDGFYGDSAITVAVGRVNETAEKLMRVTKESLRLAIAECLPGRRLGDIGAAVQGYCEAAGFSVVREFVGHGIGRAMHESPAVPNFGKRGQGRVLKPGLVIAIEPMVCEGLSDSITLNDGWTVVTKDGKLAAHFEHTVAITNDKPYILSQP